MYRKGLCVGVLATLGFLVLFGYTFELFLYYVDMFFHGPLNTDSIEAGPVKITLSNATDWQTVFKMIVTAVGTYAGVKLINKYVE